MATPQTPYDAVLQAAQDVTRVETALEAELVGAALLGSVYAVAKPGRAAALREFVGEFLEATSRRRTKSARAIRHVFAVLVPDATGAGTVRAGTQAPPWSAQLGRVHLAGAWAYGDVYGDQTSYLASFAYDDADVGGGEHAVVALVDHNIGIVKDLFVGEPARLFLDEVRAAAATDELVWLREMDPATLRAEVGAHLEITDALTSLPEDGSLATDRALVGARLATLPPPVAAPAAAAVVDPADLAAQFFDSSEAAGLDLADEETEASARYVVRLVIDFGQEAPDGNPLRWSPAVVGLFLLDWVHRRAVLDDGDVAALPAVLRAWTAWAAGQRGLPAAARQQIEETIDTMAPEFARLQRTGERRAPAVQAMSDLLAEGVDPADESAVGNWLARGGESHGIPRPR